jgi:hypothetical protein
MIGDGKGKKSMITRAFSPTFATTLKEIKHEPERIF